MDYSTRQERRVFPVSDDKRFHIPGVVIHGTCQACGNPVEYDLEERYLSYPTVGEPIQGWFYCTHEWQDEDGKWDGCYENTEFWVQLEISVFPVHPPE